CQYFAGIEKISQAHTRAIESTSGQIITFAGNPILALFSSCAGGHTEDYQNCFSDPDTGAFPPPPLPYLTGVPEGKLPPGYDHGPATEIAMRALFRTAHPETDDGWASQFRWSVHMTGAMIESEMHHTLEKLQNDRDTAPFVVAPPRTVPFRHITGFFVPKRGVAGTAIELEIRTHRAQWKVSKELVIRSVFKCPELNIARLKSARIFFDHHYDNLGDIESIDIHGLGFGHGVGLQQTGSQGLALKGMKYQDITAHYFKGTQVQVV
ncbi:MAG: SpoIID/LytB domain-containing protein, partial [Terriglobales bacterium]